jgi:hypothetical protein
MKIGKIGPNVTDVVQTEAQSHLRNFKVPAPINTTKQYKKCVVFPTDEKEMSTTLLD